MSMLMLRCQTCREIKPEDCFYVSRKGKTKSGRQGACKECVKKHAYKWHKEKGYFQTEAGKKAWDKASKICMEKYPEKFKARTAARLAVLRGELTKQPCHCGETMVEAHHHKGYDEENQLNVVWLCRKHHKEVHEKLKLQTP